MIETLSVIISQYAEEAAFLWLLREAAVGAPHYSLADLAKLDDRLEAHLDGLRLAGDEGWEICRNELTWQEPGEVFAAAVLALSGNDVARIQPVLEAARSSVELSHGFVSALGWLPYEEVSSRINQLVASSTPDLRRIGIAASSAHRRDPGKPLADSLSSDDLPLRTCAMRAAGRLGRTDLLPQLRSHFKDQDDHCRFAAGWSAALLGDTAAVEVLKPLALAKFTHHQEAMDMAMRRMAPADAVGWQKQLAGKPETLRRAVIGAGVIGDPGLIPWLIDQMATPDLARAAGEAFTMITGADLARLDLETKRPDGFESGPTENPADQDVSLDSDDDLPWPDPDLIRGWWDKQKSNFPAGTRHLLGKPMTPESLTLSLRTGGQRQRAAAALELAMRQPSPQRPLFEVRAPGVRQQRLLPAS